MATTFVTLACCLLAFSSALAATLGPTSSQMSKWDIQGSGTTIRSSSAPHSTSSTNLPLGKTGSTPAWAESATSLQTFPSATPTTFTTPTTPTSSGGFTQTAGGDTGSSGSATTRSSASSSHTVSAASPTSDVATGAPRLGGLEKSITIVLGVTLGVVMVVLSVCALCKCNRRQRTHRHRDKYRDMRKFVSDDDTLVISGGLYDAHPIYDNVPSSSNTWCD